jgi:F-type H+-transporting ATPase subunit b
MEFKQKHNKTLWTLLLALAMVAAAAACAFAQEHGGGGEEGATLMEWVWRVVNFGIIAGVLVYFLAKPMKSFMRKRIEMIETSIAEAKISREDALKRLAGVEDRLKDKDAEIKSLLSMAEENGRKEKALLLVESEKMTEDILASAKENIDAELLKAKEALRKEAALMAVELAEKLVRDNISKEDRARIIEDYLSKVGG